MSLPHFCWRVPILLFLSMTFISILSAQDYYRTLSFTHSPLHAWKGAKASILVDEVALYTFTYETGGKVKSIIYQLNGSPKPLYENYTSSTYIWAAQNIFAYRPGQIIVEHLDYLSKPIPGKPTISIYTLDEKGRAVRLQYFGEENDLTELNGIHEYRWIYEKGKVGENRISPTGEIKPMNAWFPYTWVWLSFDPVNNLSSITTTGEDWEPIADAVRIEFEVESHEIVGWRAQFLPGNQPSQRTGPKVAEARHDFDDNGYLVRTRFFDEDGKRTKSAWGHMGFVRQYNAQGNRLTYNFINAADQITLAPDRGYSGQRFIWDAEGRFRLHTSYIDLTGEPILRESAGYAQIQFLYDKLGVEIGKVYKDSAGELSCGGELESYIWLENIEGQRSKKILCD